MGLYLVQSFKGANIFTKLAFIFLLLCMFFGWIAYCTDNWGRSYYSRIDPLNDFKGYGIWAIGNDGIAVDVSKTDGWLLEWYGAFQAFATFGFICVNVGFLLVILFVFVGPCKSNSDLAFWNGILNIFGCICWLVAVILFGAYFDSKFDTAANANYKKEHQLHYSFGFAILTFLCQLVAGIVLLLTNRGGGAVSQSK